ncbi:MAG: Wadjet anti-phage system protein JetD domain-containing protein [Spirochaetia bacterium]
MQEIQKKLGSRFPECVASLASGKEFFPIKLQLPKAPQLRDYASRLQWLKILYKSAETNGFCLHTETVNKRKEGEQTIATAIEFSTLSEYLEFIGKKEEYSKAQKAIECTANTIPTLVQLISENPTLFLRKLDVWVQAVKVAQYLASGQESGCYVRELPVPGPTKFLEQNIPLLSKIMDYLSLESRSNQGDFYSRFSLQRDQEVSFRIRVLDPELAVLGRVTDFSLPAGELSKTKLPGKRIVIIENKASFLSFPQVEDSLALWGMGKAVCLLEDMSCLMDKEVFYWGDIDKDGFEILSMVRRFLPDTLSICMDCKTYLDHEKYALSSHAFLLREDLHLTNDEYKAYKLIAKLEKNRLEQEKISRPYLYKKINSMV